MKDYKIKSTNSEKTLYEGAFKNFRTCLEHAALDKVNLSYADLRHQNLTNASLDDTNLKHADFTGSNLTGANLSEANLHSARFHNTALYNTCMAYTNMQCCDFLGTSFGATDITGSNISFCLFSTLSCFDIDFTHVTAMKDCTFKNPNGLLSNISRPPIVIKGVTKMPIVIMDEHIKIEHDVMETVQWLKHLTTTRAHHKKELVG